MRAHYTRLFTGADGASQFEDMEIALGAAYANPPASPVPLADFLPTGGSFWVGVPGSWDGHIPHPCPRRQLLVTVKGEYEVTITDGTTRRFSPGSVVLVEDTSGQGHATRTVSAEDVVIFAVVLPDVEP